MKTSTPQAPKKADPISLCLQGDHGTGKTSLALCFPEPGVMDLDGNLDGPEAWHRKRGLKLSYVYNQPLLGEDGKAPKSAKGFRDAIFDSLQELIDSPKVRSIVIDSGTKLAESLVWWCMDRSGVDDMSLDLWKPWRSALLKLVHRGRNAGKNFVLLIHEQPKYGIAPRQGMPAPQIGVNMSMPSKLQEQFGFTFTDVWRAVKSGKGRDVRYGLRFVTDGEANLKNSFGLVDPMPMDWAKLAPCLKGRI